MNKTLFKSGLVIGIIVLFAGGAITSSIDAILCKSSNNDGQEFWALLVAVSLYAGHPEQNFPFPFQEIDGLYDTLIESQGWSRDHIKILRGEDATVSNIINGFRWLDNMDDDDDISLIYFNTHGGPLKRDRWPYDESDGHDEILASHWTFAYPKIYLWDDQINYYLSRLDSNGICIILDTCHAGGFDDSIFWDNNYRINIPVSKEKKLISSTSWMTDFAEDIKGNGRVILMACREHELAGMGEFSPYIIDGLRGFADSNSNGIVTAEELFSYSETRTLYQHPKIFDNFVGELPILDLTDIINFKENELIESYHIKKRDNSNFDEKQINSNSGENTMVCGFITDILTGEPIQEVYVYLDGIDEQGNYYYNYTQTNSEGFYEINVVAGEISFYYSATGYLKEKTDYYNINESETLWINVSLQPPPPNNAFVCGYITDLETQEPLKSVHINFEWRDNEGRKLSRYFECDNNGFYNIGTPDGELYLSFNKHKYCYQKTYRMDIKENETLWTNISLEKERPGICIVKPLKEIYFNNKNICPFSKTIIFGDIEVEAFVHDIWYNKEIAEKVEFYLDGDLKSTDEEYPYTWMWSSTEFFKRKHTIKIIAYCEDDYQVSEEINI